MARGLKDLESNKKTTWFWVARCDLGGYKSGYYKYQTIAKFLSKLHVLIVHKLITNYMTVGCVDSETHYKNLKKTFRP